ncbi:endonuclease [Zavarzinia aquatilis]|uniref:Endonuclease n=1 Tax=Zavarzinia aquatilis TaxID=2211142 RepID=A0A317EBT0_9PROT|nr:endonuclease [Zavarzinia aquatilis]
MRGRCPSCTRAYDQTRGGARRRGYDHQWQRVRAAFLAAHPVCCVAGCGKPATDADHIQSVRDRPDLRLAPSNLRPMCHAHHSQRTSRDQVPRGRV